MEEENGSATDKYGEVQPVLTVWRGFYLPRLRCCRAVVTKEVDSFSFRSKFSESLSAANLSFLLFLSRRSFSSSSSSSAFPFASWSEPSGCFPHYQSPHMRARTRQSAISSLFCWLLLHILQYQTYPFPLHLSFGHPRHSTPCPP